MIFTFTYVGQLGRTATAGPAVAAMVALASLRVAAVVVRRGRRTAVGRAA